MVSTPGCFQRPTTLRFSLVVPFYHSPLELIFIQTLKITTHSQNEVPQIHFHQLVVIA